jgi:pSer/pThr/pTyr-binding forkhead associated (FHA) protein
MMEMHVCNRTGRVLRAFALGDGVEVIVGRDASCDVQIRSQAVSREHCTIESDGDDLVLRDLGSTAGTFVGDRKIETLRVQDGLEVVVGPAVLKFYEAGI